LDGDEPAPNARLLLASSNAARRAPDHLRQSDGVVKSFAVFL
jgi:hypothetical protein